MAGVSVRSDYDKLLLAVYTPPPPVFVRGDGARLWDADGKEYIDFGSGIAVAALGHNAAAVADALCAQSKTLVHTSNLFATAPAVELARQLVANTFAERVFFCNSGAEANEAALKLARRRGVAIRADKYKVLSFSGGFHGRVGLAMAATPAAKVRDGFGPLADGFYTAPFNDIAAATGAMDDRFCAIIVEPVQGESGVHPATPEFLRALRQLADAHNALLIFDEVQCGNGRCGHLYKYMDVGVTPDVLTTAKGLGGGVPIGALLATDAAAAAMGVGSHGTTFGGNPLACCAAQAVLSTVLSPGFLDGVRGRAEQMRQHLAALQQQWQCFTAIRVAGLLVGCDLASGYPLAEVRAAAAAAGVLVLPAGENTLRFAPPLNIGEADIAAGFARLAEALHTIATTKQQANTPAKK